MRKRLLVFAIIFLSLLAFTLWRAQPPFRLQRKLLAKLPYMLYLTLLITDLDDDGHPEVMAVKEDEPLIWVRFPFDKPSLLRFENCRAVRWNMYHLSIPKALPVLTADRRLMLLRWSEGKATFDPLPNLPNVPTVAFVREGEGTGRFFLQVYRGKDVWVFTLTSQGHWQFASRFTNWLQSVLGWDIADLADLDRDGKLDALYLNESAWVFWGGQKEGETNLGVWMRYGYPQIADLDGDGWMEIAMVDKYGRLKIWRFNRRERRLKVIATSSPLPVSWTAFSLHLSDLDSDGRKEVVVIDIFGNYWVFQLRDGKLKMWRGKTGLRVAIWYLSQVKFGDQLALYTRQYRTIWLFPPRIWLEGRKLRWQFQENIHFAVFYLLSKGKQALSPSNWQIQKAPFELWFAGDIDGDGSDELIGRDFSWRCWRLYRAEVTKAGELRWRDVLLGREKPEPTAFALLVDGKRRGLVIAWEDGRLELLTIEGKK